MRQLLALASAALLSLSGASALAQQGAATQQNLGTVTYLKTEPGSVLVLRGSEVYQLSEGAAIFPGDRVFTRTNGAVLFAINNCEVALGGQQEIVVTDQVCGTTPTALDYNATVAGVQVGTGGEIAATPTILLALLAAGGAASAAGGGDSASP